MENANLKDLIQNKDLSGINTYIKNGGNVNVTSSAADGMNPLFWAICDLESSNASVDKDKFNVEDKIIVRLIEAGANVNCRLVSNKNTPLLEALDRKRSKNIILELLNAGSDINAVNKIKFTPLLSAIRANYDKELICKLIEMGTNVNHIAWVDNPANGCLGSTALSCALKHTDNFEITKILINAGAVVELLNFRYPFEELDCGLSCKEGRCKNEKAIDLLVSKGLHFNMCFEDYCNRTIVHDVNCNYLISLSIKSGVSVESKDVCGKTPLIIASKYFYLFEKVKSLLTLFNANPNNVDNGLRTAFRYAVEYYCYKPKICELLLFHGSDIFSKDVYNEKALDYIFYDICYDGHYPVFMLYLKYYLLYIDENNFYDYFNECKIECKEWFELYSVDCKKELTEMKRTFLKPDLTFYNFCLLKRFYKSEPIDLCSIDELHYNFDQIKEMFPVYHDFIIIRIKDNIIKNNRKRLMHNLEGIIVRPLPVENDSDIELNYDCKYLIGRYLNCEQLFRLFHASIEG